MIKRVAWVVTLIALVLVPVRALADTPTPTPTLLPIAPTPTSFNLYLRITPTPFTIVIIPQSTEFDVASSAGLLADNAINSYRAINFFHVIDFMLFMFTVYALIVLLIRAIKMNMGDK